MEWNERVSNVFGSLNATLRTVDNPIMKKDPLEDEVEEEVSKRRAPAQGGTSGGDRSRDRSPTRSHSGYYTRRGGGARKDHRSRQEPDYIKNPRKWKKYDLREDGTDKMEYKGLTDEQRNKKAAFEFLSTLRQNQSKSVEEEREETLKASDRLVFKKPSLHISSGKNSKGDGEFLSTAFKMPEGSTGASKKTESVELSRIKPVKSKPNIRLSHLEEEED